MKHTVKKMLIFSSILWQLREKINELWDSYLTFVDTESSFLIHRLSLL